MYIRSNSPAVMPNLPQAPESQNDWAPSTIANLVFAAIMVFVGIVAIWQGHRRRFIALGEEDLILIRRGTRTSESSIPMSLNETSIALTVRPPASMLLYAIEGTSTTSPLTLENHAVDETHPSYGPPGALPALITNRVTTLSTLGTVDSDDSPVPDGLELNSVEVDSITRNIRVDEDKGISRESREVQRYHGSLRTQAVIG